jgi:hypothetical protein
LEKSVFAVTSIALRVPAVSCVLGMSKVIHRAFEDRKMLLVQQALNTGELALNCIKFTAEKSRTRNISD